MLKNILVFTGEWIHISPDFIEVNFPQFRNGWNFALCYACSVTFKKRCPVCNSGNCVNFFNNAKFNLFCICHIFCLCDIQFSSVTQSCLTLCDPMNRTTPGLPVHHQLLSSLKLTCIESVMPSNHLILCCPLLFLPPIPPSIRVFSNESTLQMRWPKYWSFSLSISPSNEQPGLVSFRMDWLDLLAVQGTLKSLLQHHSSKASTLWCSAFFTVQLSHPYMTTGKTIALTRWTFSHCLNCIFCISFVSVLRNSIRSKYFVSLSFLKW